MATWRGTDRVAALVLVIALLAPGSGHASDFGGPPLAERYFSVRSDAYRSGDGATRIYGTVSNSYHVNAQNVRLLIEGLDRAGQPVSKTVAWVNGDIPAGNDRYFEAPAPVPGTTFRVTVLDFDWAPGSGAVGD